MTNLEKRAKAYLSLIIRNDLSNQRNCYPSDITDEEIEHIYNTDSLPGSTIHQSSIVSIVNGKEETSIVCAIVSRETGEWYYSNVIKNKL